MIKDMHGHSEDFLTVTAFAGINKRGNALWECLCVCGKSVTYLGSLLRKRKRKSCGCMRGKLCGDAVRLPQGEAGLRILYASYRKAAAGRRLAYTLTLEQFAMLTKLPCAYCGTLPANVIKRADIYGGYIYNGIDRQDNTVGYTADNCVACCAACNFAKRAMTMQEYFDHCQRVVDHMSRANQAQDAVA